MCTYLVLFYFVLLILLSALKKKWGICIFLFSIYAFSAFFSILYTFYDTSYNEYITLFPTVLYCAFISLSIFPFAISKPKIKGFFSEISKKRFIFWGYVISIILIIGIILVIPKIRFVFDYGIGNIREDMKSERTTAYVNDTVTYWGSFILGIFGNLCYPLVIMFFYSIIFIKKEYLFKMMLLAASSAQIIRGFFYGGRTNVMYYLLFLLFALIVFFEYIEKKQRKYILIVSFIIMFFIIAYISVVSIGRFGSRASEYYVAYIGKPYLNFCKFVHECKWHPYTLKRIFPLTTSFIYGDFDLMEYRNYIEINTGLNIGLFYTFLGDIFVDVGYFGLTAYICMYSFVARKIANRKMFDISNLLLLGIVYTIPLHGVFYYSAYLKYVTFCFMLVVVITYSLSKNSVLFRVDNKLL